MLRFFPWLGLYVTSTDLLYAHITCLHVYGKREISGVHFFSYKDISSIRLDPILTNSFNLDYVFKGPISMYSHSRG